ncbi:MAG TPA: hypothetical protein VHM70_15680 [Polyangiaceae bacterium]|nr:hypothetical protein [Polyangiaceae bacterium]
MFGNLPIEAPRFVFALAESSSAPWLKRQFERAHPDLRFAFSRPGLYTFKSPQALTPAFSTQAVFARHWGFSLGKAQSAAEVLALLEQWPAALGLWVYSREPATAEIDSRSAELDEQLRALAPGRFSAPRQRPDWTIDVILSSDAAEPWFVGFHRSRQIGAPIAGATRAVEPPAHAPSRAYGKLVEAITWAGLELERGDYAVEVGCAPGGAIVALLERGLHVTGIDPAEMAPGLAQIESTGSFSHIALPVGAVKREQLPERVQWLFCDANLAPHVALRYLQRLCKWLRPHLRAIVFTMKLNDEKIVDDLPKLLEAFGKLGQGRLRATQLPSNRREIVAILEL